MTERSTNRWVWAGLLMILAFSGGVRWRLAEIPLERDEGEYAYAGQLLRQGVPPYQAAYNMKFPGVYGAYAMIMSVLGETPRGIHLGILAINAANILLVFVLGQKICGAIGGLGSAAVYALLSMDRASLGLAGHAEHFVVLFGLAGLCVLQIALKKPRFWTFVFSGSLLGLAILMKQSGVCFAAFGVFWLLADRCRWKAIIPQIVGIAFPLVATGIVLGWAGVFGKFWFWTVRYAAVYGSEVPLTGAPRSLLFNARDVVGWSYPLWGSAALALILLWRMQRRMALFLTGLLAASFLGTSFGFYYRGHYFILMMPAAALLIGAAIGLSRVRAMVVGVFLLAMVWMMGNEFKLWWQMTPTQACRAMYAADPFLDAPGIGEYLRQHTNPTDTIAVLGSEPEIYFYAHRRSASGYIYTYGLMEMQAIALKMQKEMAEEIESSRPKYLVNVHYYSSWAGSDQSAKWIFDWLDHYGNQFTVEKRIEKPAGYISLLQRNE